VLAISSDGIQSEFALYVSVSMTDVYTPQRYKFTAGKVDVPQLWCQK